jgi:ribosome-associated toxin RatA of RatAB toxin-antitoxin module
MTAYQATRTVEIAAPVRACYEALLDYERLPEWQSRVKSCEVLTRDDQGRGRDVEYVVDAKVKTVRYRLRHDYDDGRRIGSQYLEGDFRSFSGEYTFEDQASSCLVTLRLAIDPGLRLPGPIQRMVNEAVMGRALEELRHHAEEATAVGR